MKSHQVIANTILSQLKTGQVSRHRMMCWGVNSFMSMKKEGTLGTLRFKVNGLKFKGFVYISLNGTDTYDIEFVKVKRRKDEELSKLWGKTKFEEYTVTEKEMNGIYCDQMNELIDEFVEKQSNYSY